MVKPLNIDEAWLREQYLDKELTQEEIAVLANSTTVTIRKYLKKYNISIRRNITDKTKQRMRENHANVSGKNNPRYGSHCSEDTKCKISGANRNPSDETRRKMSEAKRGERGPMWGKKGPMHPNFGMVVSEDTRKKLSESHKGLMAGEKNPMYGKRCITSEETKRKISAFFKGRKFTEIHKRRISESHKGLMAGENHPRYGKPAAHARGEWYRLPNGEKLWLRSSYEVRVVDAFLKRGVNWKYESRAFELDNCTYRPDFLIDDSIWLEVKGFINKYARKKLEMFSQYYPDENIRIVFLEDIEMIESDIPINFNTIGKSISEALSD